MKAARPLTRRMKSIFELLDLGLTQADAARVLGVSRSRVCELVKRAKARGYVPNAEGKPDPVADARQKVIEAFRARIGQV